jgi:transcriptional regulator with XRE-family HTH domain
MYGVSLRYDSLSARTRVWYFGVAYVAALGRASWLPQRQFSPKIKTNSIQSMARSVLDNYLRKHRRVSGLSQHEMAFLLGCKNAAQISRHERSRRLPSLRTVLAYQSILAAGADKLFPGVKQEINGEIARRATQLRIHLEHMPPTKRNAGPTVKKLRWLTNFAAADEPKLKPRQ